MPCPTGSSWVSEKLFCGSNEFAYGPFSAQEIETCKSFGGGNSCETKVPVTIGSHSFFLQRWARSFANSIRPTDDCPRGTSPSQNFAGYCLETAPNGKNFFSSKSLFVFFYK